MTSPDLVRLSPTLPTRRLSAARSALTRVVALACLVALVGAVPVPDPAAAARGPADPTGWISHTLARPDAVLAIGWANDPDGSEPVELAFRVNGETLATGTARRTHVAKGDEVGFRVRVPLPPGVHQLCIRATNQNEGTDRSIGCRRVTTTPPSPSSPANNDAKGVLVTASGVITPIVDEENGAFAIASPCGNLHFTRNGNKVNRTKVVIDAGHGGSESGAVGANGLAERDINLAVSKEVVRRLRALGIPTQPTRTGDYRLPIRTRGDIANALDADLFISVHHNGGAVRASPDPGNEAWYSIANPESKRLAQILWEEQYQALLRFPVPWVDTGFSGASVRVNTRGEDFFGIHRYTPEIPSVISEFVYLSNPPEAELVSRPDVVRLEAQTIVSTVLRWYWDDATNGRMGATWTADTSTGTGGFDNCVDPALG